MVRSYGDQSASMHVHFSILIDEWTGPLFLNFTKKKVIKCFWEAHQINLSFCRMNRIVHGKLSHNISSGFPERSPGPTYSLGWRKALTDRLSSHWQRDPDFWLSPLGFSRKHFKFTFWWTAEHLRLLCFFFPFKRTFKKFDRRCHFWRVLQISHRWTIGCLESPPKLYRSHYYFVKHTCYFFIHQVCQIAHAHQLPNN